MENVEKFLAFAGDLLILVGGIVLGSALLTVVYNMIQAYAAML